MRAVSGGEWFVSARMEALEGVRPSLRRFVESSMRDAEVGARRAFVVAAVGVKAASSKVGILRRVDFWGVCTCIDG